MDASGLNLSARPCDQLSPVLGKPECLPHRPPALRLPVLSTFPCRLRDLPELKI